MKNEPICNREDCFGCKEGKCIVLAKNNFGKRDCPFFKTKEQAAKDKKIYVNIYKED